MVEAWTFGLIQYVQEAVSNVEKFGDNKSVLYNTTLTKSTLENKINSIAYHAVREGVATGERIAVY